jgi:dGTP triphosphohydrolase
MILITEDCGSIPLAGGFIGRSPFSQAGNMVLNLQAQALTKPEGNVQAIKITGFVHHLLESINILINGL